ncbi:2-oxoacid:acceptor oxidoreductase subunit alpha [uncultured Alistipes sp.]|jgi:2-oxoacid:acceptor oxidoreductase, alpha subunit|uniref:2-oxoacid:acceptor oxidoreductase subunit alpha n=1 Tax=uncultured Alistipes sp. TaxID=538949 RepID=UPI0025FE8C1A|nr:2-oxoacid:acceptor oxidoreductase subunit alpha [uncultured Alistipes sp.]
MSKNNVRELQDVVIRFSGDSGDGMQLTGSLFSDTSALVGNGISTFPDYPAEIRAPQGTIAGVSGFQVHFGNRRELNPGDYCDVLVAMNPAALKANRKWLKPDATVILDGDSVTDEQLKRAGFATTDLMAELQLDGYNVIIPDITSMTREALKDSGLDNKAVVKCKNMFALGICFYLFDRPEAYAFKYLETKFVRKNPAIAEANKLAIRAGYNYAANTHQFANTYTVAPAQLEKGTYRSICGNTATAWGLCAAAEKAGLPLFCGSYPITPATVILEELAKRKDLGVKTVQAEDEITGICTAIGAAYTGNFAVTTTSGPGLSLKSEALGLAVMTELPLVVVDVQRGGPSTGLPTKTEQSDLMQALYGRNGECPLIVMAASSPSDCFHYAFEAGRLTMEHMTPVILLTDGFIANGTEPLRVPSMKDYPAIKPPIVDQVPEGGFMPYARNGNLARGWAFPGKAGLEHRVGGLEKDALKGSISHDAANHQNMVKTRAEKVAKVADDIPMQEVYGDAHGDLLVVGWGGTRGHLQNTVDVMRAEGRSVSLCHFNYINPLPHGVREIFSKFRSIVVCELNEGQFAAYLRQSFQEFRYEQYNKCEGLPFTVNELKDKFESLLK